MRQQIVFESGKQGRKGVEFPAIPGIKGIGRALKEYIPEEYLSSNPPALPELSELDVVRHFTRLSQSNYCVDTVMYPLGSCTMKYNPKVNEILSRHRGWQVIHPYQSEKISQGILKVLYETGMALKEICGMDACCLQPAAGAHGEFLGLLLIRAFNKERGEERRTKIVVPDSGHGTNPSSANSAGFNVVSVPSGRNGEMDIDAIAKALDENTAAVMITNPNTLGIFETRIMDIAEMAHKKGVLLYGDGANMNALMGRYRPGDMGFDVMHVNLHKTFSTPHGGGGPGSGPVLVKKELEPYLPVPDIKFSKGGYGFNYSREKSIGRIRAFYGNTGVILKAYAYIKALGSEGIRKAGGMAVLNANYMMNKLRGHYHVPYQRACAHEFVLSASESGGKAVDIAKRLLDRGFYAPTIYFPLIVREAIMIEPTETESKDTMDSFIETLISIKDEPVAVLQNAPHTLPVSRLDEVGAAKNLDVVWKQK